MFKEFLFLFLAIFAVTSSIKKQCKEDSECGADECCYYHEGPMVVSKKRQINFPHLVQGGWCEKYKLHGEWCSGIARMNGHCECGPGLKCVFIKDNHPVTILNRREPLFGGHSECLPSS